jgi:hypothetical protein
MNESEKPTHLDLFSGIGGFSLAFEAEGFKTIGFSETDPFAARVLKKRWPNIPNYGDVRTISKFAQVNSVIQMISPAFTINRLYPFLVKILQEFVVHRLSQNSVDVNLPAFVSATDRDQESSAFDPQVLDIAQLPAIKISLALCLVDFQLLVKRHHARTPT